MDNNTVITKLQECVTKLENAKQILIEKRNKIPASDEPKRQQIAELDILIAEMNAKIGALESIITERRATDAVSIPPLSPALVDQFKAQMDKLNVVIQADQNFDKIVAVAKGINEASAEISKTTG